MADLIYEVKDHLARITLNRPKQLNCFSEEMIHLWTQALEDEGELWKSPEAPEAE